MMKTNQVPIKDVLFSSKYMYITSTAPIIFAIAIITATALTLLTSFTSAYATGGYMHHRHSSNLKCTPTLVHLTDQSVTSIQYLCNVSKSHTANVHLPDSLAVG